jgi:hypothetical protein
MEPNHAAACSPRVCTKLGGEAVRVTEVPIPDANDLSERLTDMRVWLDEHRYEPSTFAYFFIPPGMTIRVSFKVEDEAKKFAERFDGSLLDIPRAIDQLPTV